MNRFILDGHKLLWHTERLKVWMAGERIAPITIDCALTRKCTYRCVYCYGQLQSNDEKKITRDVIFRFLDDAAQIGVKAISFVSDGESTCSPYLYDAVKRGRANGLDIAMGTNGYLLKDEELENILPCLTYIRFNISAAEPLRYAQIMGCKRECFAKVRNTIKKTVAIKKERNLHVTIGLQMVLLPEFKDQIMPFVKLGKELRVDYAIIKHCSDDENRTLGVNYSKYRQLAGILKEAEDYTDGAYQAAVKWSKINSDGKRRYARCYGPAFIMQFSGSGLVAPCGMLFNSRYSKYHIGNIAEAPFKKIWKSKRYQDVLSILASGKFDPQTQCGTLCLQHKVNEFLWDLKQGSVVLEGPPAETPMHVNFV